MINLRNRILHAFFLALLFLLFDFVRVALVGNHFRQEVSSEGFLRVALINLLLVVLAGLVFQFLWILVPRRVRSRARTGRFLNGVFLAAVFAALCLVESQHHYKGVVPGLLAGAGGGAVILALSIVTAFGVKPRVVLGGTVVGLVVPFLVSGFSTRNVQVPGVAGSGNLPNIFLIVVDTVRSDHLSCYGYSRQTTPFLDRLATESIRFENAYSATSTTTPSTAALLGAPYPFTDDFPENRMSPDRLGLAEYLNEAGYRTGAVSANPFISPEMGFDRGFHSFENLRFPEKDFAVTHVLWVLAERLGINMPDHLRGELVNRRVKRWLETLNEEGPVFGYVHYMDPHYPYTPQAEFRDRFHPADLAPRQRFETGVDFGQVPFAPGTPIAEENRQSMIALYDAEIAQWDRALEELWGLLGERGLLERCLVFITSDHGEAFFEHGAWLHGNSLHEEVLRVPFLIYRSGDREGKVVPVPVSNTRTFSLIRRLIEETETSGSPDADLIPVSADEPIVAQHSYAFYRGAAVIQGGIKRVVMLDRDHPFYAEFDLEIDPGESASLIRVPPAEDLSVWEGVISTVPTPLGNRQEMGKSTEELLRSLGYVQ